MMLDHKDRMVEGLQENGEMVIFHTGEREYAIDQDAHFHLTSFCVCGFKELLPCSSSPLNILNILMMLKSTKDN